MDELGMPAIAGALAGLAALDGAFSGFRASAGRTGLIAHRRADVIAGIRGLAVAVALLAAPLSLAVLDLTAREAATTPYRDAGRAMLAVYLPYAGLILAALACYGLLGWRRRFLAAAVILGPGTLLRPFVALGGAVAGALAADRAAVAALALLAAMALLAVEPAADRLWYAGASR